MTEVSKDKLEYLEGERNKAYISHFLTATLLVIFFTIVIVWVNLLAGYSLRFFHVFVIMWPVCGFLSYLMVERVFKIPIVGSMVEEMEAKKKAEGEEIERRKIEQKVKLLYIFIWAVSVGVIIVLDKISSLSF